MSEEIEVLTERIIALEKKIEVLENYYEEKIMFLEQKLGNFQIDKKMEISQIKPNELLVSSNTNTKDNVSATFIIKETDEKKQIEIFFSTIPPENIRNKLKENNFIYVRSSKSWKSKYTEDRLELAKSLGKEIVE